MPASAQSLRAQRRTLGHLDAKEVTMRSRTAVKTAPTATLQAEP